MADTLKSYVSPFEWGPDETPPYAFCEPVWVATSAPWCIRPINPKTGLHLTGGVDTASFCGRVKPSGEKGGNGWDLKVRITEHHLKHCCPKCREEYLAAVKEP